VRSPNDPDAGAAQRRPVSGLTRVLFGLVVVVSCAVALVLGLAGMRWRRLHAGGVELNRLAWEASFRERGWPVPSSGPRDGYWGRNLPRPVPDPLLGWREAEVHRPGLVETDAFGVQTIPAPSDGATHVLIIGGSVAWGAYASTLDKTYFALLARRLDARGRPVRITVLAAGAWESGNELAAFREKAEALDPDVVVFLDGLNDLTQAGRRRRHDPSRIPPRERVGGYLATVQQARDLALARRLAIVFAPQPFVPQKPVLSDLEARAVEASLDSTLRRDDLAAAYARLRAGVAELARGPRVFFVDCAGAFDAEAVTTFTDLYHFADPGHAILADRLAGPLATVIAALNASPPRDSRPGAAHP
jgi:hypothetical protein